MPKMTGKVRVGYEPVMTKRGGYRPEDNGEKWISGGAKRTPVYPGDVGHEAYRINGRGDGWGTCSE